MGIWRLVMKTNRLSRPSGCPPGVSQPFHILGRSALVGLCRQTRVKTGKNRRVVWPRRRGKSNTWVLLLPTVADCTHVMGPIMFEWVRSISAVSQAFLIRFYRFLTRV
jgi:hypothetical protein